MTPDLDAETTAALRTWVDFFEEHVTDEGGPVAIRATFKAQPHGTWMLLCSRDKGTVLIGPDDVEHDADELLKEHA